MKFIQTKPQIKNKNINYFDLYYTVIKVRDENKYIDNQYEDEDNKYTDINDFITPVGIKLRETKLN